MEVGVEGREQEGYSVLRGKYACQVYYRYPIPINPEPAVAFLTLSILQTRRGGGGGPSLLWK